MGLSPAELKSALHGFIGFGVTPFYQDFRINEESFPENASRLEKHCDVVVAMGNNGEIFSLSVPQQKLVGLIVVEEIGKRKPVLVGTGFLLPDSRELAQAAETYGADGILILPPRYHKSNDDGLFACYQAIAQSNQSRRHPLPDTRI